MNRLFVRFLNAIIFVVAAINQVDAQVSVGAHPFGSFGEGPFDTVDLGNLNVHFEIPVLYKSGRGVPFNYNLGYDSSIWSPVSVSGTFSWQPVFNWGWESSYTANTGHVSYKRTTRTCKDADGFTGTFSSTSSWVYHDAHGTDHPFSGSTTVETGSCGTVNNSTLTSTAKDGSELTLNVANNGSNAQIITAGGSTIVPGLQLGNGGTAASVIASDSNGNQITSNSSGVFTDTLGANALTVIGSGTASSPITLQYTPPSGAPTQYMVNYVQYTVRTNFGVTTSAGATIAEYGPNSVALVDNITLPDASQYTFTYEATPGTCTPLSGTFQANCVTARIASVTLPTGGKITYTYNGGPNSTGIFNDGSTAGLVRILSPSTSCTSGGCWQYSRTLLTGSPGTGATWKSTVIDPASNNTVLNFAEDGNTSIPTYGLFETIRQVYQGSNAPANLLQTNIRCYNSNFANCSTATVSTPISEIDAYTQLPNGNTRLSEMQYNGISNGSGLLSQDREYDYGVSLGTAPGTSHLVRETIATWQALGNNVNEQTNITVNDWTTGTAVLRSSSTYTYDSGSLASTVNTPQHIAVTGAHGNVTTIASQVNSTTILYRQFTYYDTGTLNTASGVSNSNTATCASNPSACTTYNYSATNNASCGNSFVTSISEPIGLTRSTVWNCTGGMSTQVTDENGQSVSATYNDPDFWRPSAVTDQANAQANISYISPTASEASVSFNGGASLSDERDTVDEFGRPILGQRRQSPTVTDYDTVETDYDAVGLPNRTTLPFVAAAGVMNATASAISTTHDALGRILAINKADGGKVSFTYTNNDVLEQVSGAQTFQKQYEYDGLGRLASVCEITTATGNGSCGQSTAQNGFLTKYMYDAMGNLTGVTQNAQPGSSATQTRTYAFDMAGRLTSEQNPESGTTTYVYDTESTACGSITSPGDLVLKTDANGNITCFYHDALHRLVHESTVAGSGPNPTPERFFVYDSATVNGVAMVNALGRLAEAYTCNTCTGAHLTDEGFSYSARGEVTDVFESTPHSAGVYHTTAAYAANGTLQSLSGMPGIPATTYGVDGEGRWTSAQQGTTKLVCDSSCSPASTSYNAAGQPLKINIGGVSDSDIYTYDSNTGRMKTFTFTVGSPAKTLQGTLSWNSNGSLQTLALSDGFNSADTQTCNYLYDDLGRIGAPPGSSSPSVNCGTVWQQTFTYDAFGNITKSGSLSWNPGYNSQNHYTLAGTSYDLNGNLLKDTFHTYTWDADGHAVTIDSTTCGTNGTCLTYDALGRLVEKNVSGTFSEIVYSPVGKAGVMSGQTSINAYIPLPGGATIFQTPGGTMHFYHKDWLGSVRLATALLNRTAALGRAFAPFGETYVNTGLTTEADFTGDTQDTLGGLYDTPNRELHPKQGRWISPDPAGLGAVDLTNPQTWNRYAYVGNTPLSTVDPSGLCDAFICVTVWGKMPGDYGSGGGAHVFQPESRFQREGGGGGRESRNGDKKPVVTNPSKTDPQQQQITDVLSKIKSLLECDPDCKAFLSSKGADPVEYLSNFITNNLYGHADISMEGNPYIIGAVSSGADNQAITVNNNGAFFNASTPNGQQLTVGPKGYGGATPRAKAFILLHEIGHDTQVLQPDTGKPRVGQQNDADIQAHCKKTLDAFSKK